MNRTIYLIRDLSSGRYYNTASINFSSHDKEHDAQHCTPQKTFEGAIIHTTLESVKSGVKSRIRSWKRQSEYLKTVKQMIDDGKYTDPDWVRIYNHGLELYNTRKCLPDFGMQIISITVQDVGEVVPLK